ncbi:MAG TPA: beta-ribofuranosylaminobenzene 5'-phosphate synthase family protein [Gemmatimonadaceae bacterium]|nr:beta-ribofuranosylaminobenzene 5'-phosphate synthase family protein [Gemmatimonadaceae bacterium]
MTARQSASPVFVEAPARLHFGMLDLRGELGRRFGGIGAGVSDPSLLLEVLPDETLSASGPDAQRATDFARRFLEYHAVSSGARITVHRAIPAHAGLGSGTQLALAVARALAELYALPSDAAALAAAVGRGKRSAVGTWVFAHGGFILEGGHAPDDHTVSPLLARLPVPSRWRAVLAIPPGKPGVSGETEASAFAALPPPAKSDVERVAHLVLMALLPALVAADLDDFGAALTEIQCINGGWFAPAQGGPFAPGETTALVRAFSEWGATGVGQSSWGPAAYAIAGDEDSAQELAVRARSLVGDATRVIVASFDDRGARVWRGTQRQGSHEH